MTKNLDAKQLIEAINEKKDSEETNEYINALSEKIDDASKQPLFYSLPINVISSIVQKAVFYEEKDPITLIKTIIDKTSKAHEKEAILLLNDFSIENLPQLTIENIIDILSQFKSSELLTKLWELQEEENCLLVRDYQGEIKELEQKVAQQNQEVAELKMKVEGTRNQFPPVKEKPDDFEPDIVSCEVSTGIQGYYYLLDTKLDSSIDPEKCNFTSSNYIQELVYGHGYVHVCAKDMVGNIGPTTTVDLESLHFACLTLYSPNHTKKSPTIIIIALMQHRIK